MKRAAASVYYSGLPKIHDRRASPQLDWGRREPRSWCGATLLERGVAAQHCQDSNSGRCALSFESVGVSCTSPTTNGHAASAPLSTPPVKPITLYSLPIPAASTSRAAAFPSVSARSGEEAERCSASTRCQCPYVGGRSAAKADRVPLLYQGKGREAPQRDKQSRHLR